MPLMVMVLFVVVLMKTWNSSVANPEVKYEESEENAEKEDIEASPEVDREADADAGIAGPDAGTADPDAGTEDPEPSTCAVNLLCAQQTRASQ